MKCISKKMHFFISFLLITLCAVGLYYAKIPQECKNGGGSGNNNCLLWMGLQAALAAMVVIIVEVIFCVLNVIAKTLASAQNLSHFKMYYYFLGNTGMTITPYVTAMLINMNILPQASFAVAGILGMALACCFPSVIEATDDKKKKTLSRL